MGPAELGRVLGRLEIRRDPRVLVGYESSDDASVIAISDDLLLVQTLDFFTPVVDDPYHFGKIAAANALSDIYAMGAEPLMALNIVCFPMRLGEDVLSRILQGGADKACEAGISIAGGHTVEDAEPKYGLSVSGIVDRRSLKRNSGAMPGDVLVLTKPIGSGALTTAFKMGRVGAGDMGGVISVMEELNGPAAGVMKRHEVHACTDVTGFGLLGHLGEMAEASGAGACVRAGDVPLIPESVQFFREGLIPGGSWSNMEYLKDKVDVSPDVSPHLVYALHDAQTSGGLLMACAPASADALCSELASVCPRVARIGEIRETRRILVV